MAALAVWLGALQVAGAAVFVLAGAAAAGLRRRSAAVRRGVWALAIAVALALPLTRLALPAPAAWPGSSAATAAVSVWALGAGLLLARLVDGWRRARGLRRRSAPVTAAAWREDLRAMQDGAGRPAAELRASDELDAPVTCGVWAPAIVVPRAMLAAPASARRSALAHELAHVARADCLLALAGAVARAVYWPLPPAWWALRQLRARAEDAADDAVLQAGVPSSSYAALLLAVARARLARAGQVAAGGLRGRIGAVLDAGRARAPARVPRWSLPRLAGSALLLATMITACEARTASAGDGPAPSR